MAIQNKIKALEKARLHQQALQWRKEYQKSAGVVLIYQGEIYGWKNELRDPQHECPGTLAIDEQGRIWKATGGNNACGAKEWEAIT